MNEAVQFPNTEAISKETATRTEYSYFNADYKPVHKSKVVYKNKAQINIYPFNYNEATGVKPKRISEIEMRGWSDPEKLPKLIKPGKYVSLTHGKIAPLMRLLYAKYPDLKKLVVIKDGGSTRFSKTTATFKFSDLEKVCKAISKEIATYTERRKTATQNALAEVSTAFSPKYDRLKKGDFFHFLSHHDDDIGLSAADTDALLRVITHVPMGNVTVTDNFIQTKNQINVAFLDKVIERYEALLDVKTDNEKDWQEFFDEYAWILASVFPFQVIMRKREAYVGGKTIENKEGRVVDFLYQNGFRDNYALLEVKTHNKQLLKPKAYREPDAFAQHEDCSGAVSQCLDQKHTFLTEFGQKYSVLDPKVVLVIGMKDRLSENQVKSLELMRNNQKNVEIVTFDELLAKIYGLQSILQE